MKKQRTRRHLIRFMFFLAVAAFIVVQAVDFVRFPECYMSAWRYQLENDLAEGDPEAVEYYEKVYVSNGRTLFER